MDFWRHIMEEKDSTLKSVIDLNACTLLSFYLSELQDKNPKKLHTVLKLNECTLWTLDLSFKVRSAFGKTSLRMMQPKLDLAS